MWRILTNDNLHNVLTNVPGTVMAILNWDDMLLNHFEYN